MSLAAALAVLVMMAALATAHPAQHKLHQVEILNFDVHSFGKSILRVAGIRRDGHLLFEVEMYLQKAWFMVSGVGSS